MAEFNLADFCQNRQIRQIFFSPKFLPLRKIFNLMRELNRSDESDIIMIGDFNNRVDLPDFLTEKIRTTTITKRLWRRYHNHEALKWVRHWEPLWERATFGKNLLIYALLFSFTIYSNKYYHCAIHLNRSFKLSTWP